MESVMTNPMAPAAYYFYTPEQTVDARRHGSFLPQQPQFSSQPQQFYYMMPPTPTYSRPSSSSSQPQIQMPQPQQVLMSQPQPLKSYVNGPVAYPVVGSNARRSIVGANGKPTIMLETDFVDVDGLRLPSTPPLSSTTSSAIGSPSACDMLATPLNPMFSGLDSFKAAKDVSSADVAAEQFNAAAWSNCASPPFAPVFIQAQSQSTKALAPNGLATPTALPSDLLSVSACPSLSPSPSPYARSVASEQDNDFCDPRNLTVCGSEGSLSPTFSAVQAVPSPAAEVEDDFVLKNKPTPAASAVSPAPVADFIPHLSVLEEFPDLESDDDFVNTLVNLGAEYSSASSIASADLSLRSRASSSVTAHSEFEFFDSWETSNETTEASHPSKRQRTSSGSSLVMSTVSESDAEGSATGSSEQGSEAAHNENGDVSNNDSVVDVSGNSATPEEEESAAAAATENASSVPVPTNRRGRKQSLTEDPSKIFACDLCNRRFRRQEHLKRHYRSLHTHDKPFNCHECGKKFSRSDNLAQHARTHGAGAMVMNVFDDADMMAVAAGGYMPHVMYPGHPGHPGHPMAMGDDYSGMGRVLFQVAAEIPGSASEHSSDDSDGQKKKRKRMD
ncbi:hypothetical protein SCUCBS95973_008890 [Sporothrix curviconia]|uniref:C2H2-type domain-containing protein n=1 Tax=Sporothrix curviconia TaxID=1260050 RepID=A0ABP0CTD3_9PEZI